MNLFWSQYHPCVKGKSVFNLLSCQFRGWGRSGVIMGLGSPAGVSMLYRVVGSPERSVVQQQQQLVRHGDLGLHPRLAK